MGCRSRNDFRKNRLWPAKALPNELPNSTHRKRPCKLALENRNAPTTHGEKCCSARLFSIDWKMPAMWNSRSASATGCAASFPGSSPEIPTRRFLQICSVKPMFPRSLLPIAKRQARRSQIRPRLRPDKRLRSRIISERRRRQRFRLRQVLEVNSRCVPTALSFDSRAPGLRSISRTVLAALLHRKASSRRSRVSNLSRRPLLSAFGRGFWNVDRVKRGLRDRFV